MNLIYMCVFHNKKYIRLLELLLLSFARFSSPVDLLVLTSVDFVEDLETLFRRIGVSCRLHCLPCSSIFDAACARLHVFEWPEIHNYDKILYLDTDIIIRRDVSPIFSFPLEKLYGVGSGTLASTNFGGQFFDFSWIDSSTQGMNSGTLLFPCTQVYKDLFQRILKHTFHYKANPPYAIDQPFINFHVFTSGLANTVALAPHVSLYEDMLEVYNVDTASVCHFSYPIGNFDHKYIRMSKFFKELLLTPSPSSPSSMELPVYLGKKFSWDMGYIHFLDTMVKTTWGEGTFVQLDTRTVSVTWNNHQHVLKFNKNATEFTSIRVAPLDFDFVRGNFVE